MHLIGRKTNAVAKRVALEITTRLRDARGVPSFSTSHLSAAVETAVVVTPAGYQVVGTHIEAVDVTCPVVVVVLERAAVVDVAHLVERFNLSRRQAEVARLLALGHSNAQIASALAVSAHTARHHTEIVLAKFSVHSRAAIAALVSVGTLTPNAPPARASPSTVAPGITPIEIATPDGLNCP